MAQATTAAATAHQAECAQLRSLLQAQEGQLTEAVADNGKLLRQFDGARAEMTRMGEQLSAVDRQRRALHERLMDLRGNIRILCRIRPPMPSRQPQIEANEGQQSVEMVFPSGGSQLQVFEPPQLGATAPGGRPKKAQSWAFEFNRVLQPAATQDAVWDELCGLVQSAVDGFNVCIFAYGLRPLAPPEPFARCPELRAL